MKLDKGRFVLTALLVLITALMFAATATAGVVQETVVDEIVTVYPEVPEVYNLYFNAGDQVTVQAICIDIFSQPGIIVEGPGAELIKQVTDNYAAYPCFYYENGGDDIAEVSPQQLYGWDSARTSFVAETAGWYEIEIWNLVIYNTPALALEYEPFAIQVIITVTSTVEEEVVEEVPIFCTEDGRINENCGAPVAIYTGSIDVYSIDPNSAMGMLSIRLSDEEIEEMGVPELAPSILATATNPYTGRPITLYRLTTGEFQLNTYYWDGKPYVVRWNEGDSFAEIVLW